MMTTFPDNPVVSHARFLFEAVGRAQACKCSPQPPSDPGEFLRFRYAPSPRGSVSVMHCLPGSLWSMPLRTGKRGQVQLRNLRYVLEGVGPLLFQRCAGCGWCQWLPEGLFQDQSTAACERCKAQPSTLKCATWHTFGICDQCSDEQQGECPFALVDDGSSRVVESHVSAA